MTDKLKQVKEHQKEYTKLYINAIKERHWFKTKAESKKFLDYIDPKHYENDFWEAGYLSAIEDVINILSIK